MYDAQLANLKRVIESINSRTTMECSLHLDVQQLRHSALQTYKVRISGHTDKEGEAALS